MAAQLLPPYGTMPASSLPPEQVSKIAEAAQDFEALAIGELLAPMFNTVDTANGPFGGGPGEEAFKPMLISEMAKHIAAHGGLGLAKPVLAQMLRAQEAQFGQGATMEKTP
ncbi:MAG: rod-binding protein [Acetobacteraceae bacterium]|nr:rod-binding protein [Acetobacteraceae bacterium]